MARRRQIDPLGRQAVLAIAAGRVAIGVGALLATAPSLKLLGFPELDAPGKALGRIAGSRDIALGLLAISTRDDATALRLAALTATVVDAADAVCFGIAARDPATRKAGLSGVASGGAAALAGAWAWRRLAS
jgi:hypothetical protein